MSGASVLAVGLGVGFLMVALLLLVRGLVDYRQARRVLRQRPPEFWMRVRAHGHVGDAVGDMILALFAALMGGLLLVTGLSGILL